MWPDSELYEGNMRTIISTRKCLLYGVIVIVLFLLIFESIARVVEFIRPPEETLSLSLKQKDSYRIFVYGGSTVAGMPLKEVGFVSQLEFWLREIHPEKALEVYNFGRPGSPSTYVRRMVEESISHGPDLVIVLSGHNEFLQARIERLPNKIVTRFALTRVLVRILNNLRAALFPLPENDFMPIPKVYDRDSSLFKEKVQVYLDNLRGIAETTRKNNIPLLLLTVPSNVSEWPPVYKRIVTNGCEEYESWIAEVDKFLADGLSDRAIESIHKLLHTYRNNPLLLI